MGKSKKRSLNLGKNNQIKSMTREQAIKQAVNTIQNRQEVLDLITLFGITAEELLEAGATYEDVISYGGMID